MEVRQTSRHIAEVHLKMSLHQCPVCYYGAAGSRLVRRHMKSRHRRKEVEVSHSNIGLLSSCGDLTPSSACYIVKSYPHFFLNLLANCIFIPENRG